MYRTAARKHSRHNDIDLYADLEKIRSAFADTALDMRGKAGEMLNQSVETVKGKSTELQGNLADYTAGNPFKSLGMALVTGIAIGWFLHK